MNYHVNSFTPKHFASQYSETLVDPIASSGGGTYRLSSTTALDDEGFLSIDTASNLWEVIYYSSKNDGASTITIPSWGRQQRGNLSAHEATASVKQVSSAELMEYFDRSYGLIQQGQMVWKSGLDFKILPFNGRLGTYDIAYAGSDQTAPGSATTYYWLNSAGTLVTGASYPANPIIKLGHIVATTAITDIYDDRLVNMSNDVVASIGSGNDYSIPTTKAIIDYLVGISSGVISINGTGGAKILIAGTGMTITESPAGTFTFTTSALIDPLTTRGDLMVRGASVPERLAKGSQGSQLISGATDPIWMPQAVSTLTDGTTINIDLSLSSVYKVVLGGTNRVFTVTNLYPCTKELLVYQDATGSRTISDFKWRTETFTADEATDLLTVANVYKTGQRVQASNSGGALPTGLSATTNYYVIYVSDTTVKLATTRANAIAGTAINITANGSGTNTLESYAHYADGTKFTLSTSGGALDKLFIQYTDNTFSISTGNFDEK